MRAAVERFFRLEQHGTTLRREVTGGATTFATMAYIAVVNPAILSFAGIPAGPSTVATLLTAASGTLLMGLYANRPIAVAPYMGENAFIAFGLAGLGITWQERLGAVFLAGVAFAAITLLGVRARLAASISPSMKHAFGAAIGLFLAFIGLYETGIVTSAARGMPSAALAGPDGLLGAPPVPVKIGDVGAREPLLAVLGIVVTGALLVRRVPAAILLGIAATALAGAALGLAKAPAAAVALPFSGDLSLAPVALQLDIPGALRPAFLPVLLTLLLMSFFDTLGTLVAVGHAAGLADERGDIPEIEKPMLVDAAACAFAGLVGTSTSGAYIESATGIREGARTGLAAVATAALFLLALFFVPLLEPLQRLTFAYGPALVVVGVLMTGSARRVDFDDLTEALPAVLTIALVVFTYNIADGLTAGLLLHPAMKLLAGRAREVPAGGWALAALSAAYYGAGVVH
jgi:AGZA family xanthine/uracil permease-like MFS transporter